jgi:hypothetical protein
MCAITAGQAHFERCRKADSEVQHSVYSTAEAGAVAAATSRDILAKVQLILHGFLQLVAAEA